MGDRRFAAARWRRKDNRNRHLLEVLDLLPNPLQLFLRRDYVFLDLGVTRLAANRVRLAHHLLENESESFADGIGGLGLRRLTKRGDVRSKAIQLLRDVEFVGEDSDFLSHPLRIGTCSAKQLADGALDALVVLLQANRCLRFNPGESGFHSRDALQYERCEQRSL